MNNFTFFAIIFLFLVSISNAYAKDTAPYQNLQEYEEKKVVNTKEIVIADISSYTYLSKQNLYDKKSTDVYEEINSISATGVGLDAYFNGRNLAVSEINAKGGINGKKIKILTVDDRGDSVFAERFAEKLINEQGVIAIMGGNITKNAIAVARVAERKKVFYITSGDYSDTTAWQMNTKYTYRLKPSAYVTGTVWGNRASKEKIDNWTIIIPSDIYGIELAQAFEDSLKKSNPNVVINKKSIAPFYNIGTDFFRSMSTTNPKGVFIATYGPDLVTILNSNTREQSWFFNNKTVLCLECGSPEWNYYIKNKIPKGWISGGYPAYFIKNKTHTDFYKAYVNRYRKQAMGSSLYGYTSVYIIADLVKNNLINKENALNNTSINTPFGTLLFRADHQSTIGVYIGETILQNKNLFLTNIEYTSGDKILPPLNETMKWRQNRTYKGLVNVMLSTS